MSRNLILSAGLACFVAQMSLSAQVQVAPREAKTTKAAKLAKKAKDASSKVDAKIAKYRPVDGVSGTLNSIGSDTLNNLMTLWAEGFRKVYKGVKIQIEGKGSSTAPPALIAGTSQLGPMSRKMKPTELDKFEKKFGYKPTRVPVAIDALAVYVHKDNPIRSLSLKQIDAIFSKTRKGGLAEIKTWGQLGLSGEWKDKPIRLYGRNSASGTYGYFKKIALFKGDYKNTVKEQPGSASVVRSVTEDLYGMGYSGIGYKTSGVKTVMLSKKKGKAYSTKPKDVLSGKYPLARFLYIYVNRNPRKGAGTLVSEFLRYALSREGQIVVVKDGYLPLSHRVVEKSLQLADERGM